MSHVKKIGLLILLTAMIGCDSESPRSSPRQRYEQAKQLFETAARDYHLPSAQAVGEQRRCLEQQAAAAYSEIIRTCADQPYWAAQAMHSLANIRAAQTNVDEAVALYAEVAERYPRQDFEVLMTWKSAGDLLWESGRRAEARKFYAKLVARFDHSEAQPVVKIVVRGSKARLEVSPDAEHIEHLKAPIDKAAPRANMSSGKRV